MKYRPMNVEGQIIDEEQQRVSCENFLTLIRRDGARKARALEALLVEAGVPAEPAYRAADRLIQKMRKAKIVAWASGSGWVLGDAAEERA